MFRLVEDETLDIFGLFLKFISGPPSAAVLFGTSRENNAQQSTYFHLHFGDSGGPEGT